MGALPDSRRIDDRAAPRVSRYRRSGADLPLADVRRAHGVRMEGYYWRITDAERGLTVVALCGLCRAADGSWASVALACDPGRHLSTHVHQSGEADFERLGVRAGSVFVANENRLTVELDGDNRLEATFSSSRNWPRRLYGGLGPAHWIPGLPQYWHPHLLGARIDGDLVVSGQRTMLADARVYAEKNWGSAFPRRWWWGQTHDFGGDDVCVAFAGGELTRGVSASAIVVRIEDQIVRLSAPLGLVRSRAGAQNWRLIGRGPLHTITIDGFASGEPFALPVPIPAQRRSVPIARQHLAATMRISVRRGRKLLFSGESLQAGLEYGG